MSDTMTFPETWEEFEKIYGFDDSEEVYTNGSRSIPSFRVKQWLDHIAHLETKQQATVSSDCIIRQDAKDVVDMELDAIDHVPEWVHDRLLTALDKAPSTQINRDIPKEPKEITDSTWGIDKKQAVCPKCDYYLGHVAFLGGRKGKKITYCEHCGQAIDWEGWDFDE